jgi:hypothetical protein
VRDARSKKSRLPVIFSMTPTSRTTTLVGPALAPTMR